MKKFLLIFLILMMIPTTSKAVLPQGVQVKIHNIEYRAFSLEEYKEILILEANFKDLEINLKYANELAILDNKLIDKLRDKIDSLKRSNTILIKDRDRIFLKWKEENQLRHISEVKVNWSEWIAWSVAATTTVASVVLVAVLATRRD
jgi:hypothetical protein